MGSYEVQARDANGFLSPVITVAIGDQAGLSMTVTDSSDISCNGGITGRIVVSASGNNPPLTYVLTGDENRSQANGIFGDLAAGTYTVFVTDANGCETTPQTITLVEPGPLSYTIDSITPASCDDNDPSNDDGGIFFTASGGTGDLTYTVDGTFVDDGNVQNLGPGQYEIIIYDENGCTLTLDADDSFVPTLPPLSFDYNVIREDCFGDNDGRIKVLPEGGARPYLYEVSGAMDVSSQISLISDLVPGDYLLTVSDACTTLTETVNMPEGILIEAAFETSPPLPFTDSLPDVELAFLNLTTITYARPEFPTSWFWNFGDGYTSSDSVPMPHDYLETGTYDITLIVNQGACWDTVRSAGALTVGLETFNIPNVITPNEDGINDELIVGSDNFLNINLVVFDRNGTTHFAQQGSQVIWRPDPELPEGVYFYTLTYIDGAGTRQRITGNVTLIR